ncbi:ABC transporter permease [Paenibacillus doosanensis]|uniref:ABC transporter permease n=1 Tax=Paenibacillus doosanensis TaxID=1229154 RepID=UPI00217F6BC2|nr:ABC transporter permease [Paenibacillus doosanensis]MCS7464876.1 ABC transporter permease [Paenibacillus doosanensis]
MSISLKRARAIFVKDYKEFSRNYAISIMLIFPIILALLFRSAGPNLPGAIGFLHNISFVLLTCFVQACLIAEEKERNTLRSLMMTPATIIDVLVGKSALVFVMSAVVLIISLFIFGYEPASLWAFVAANIVSIILYTALGTICGLYSKTLLDASLSILPVAMIFSGAPWGAVIADDYPIFKVLDYMPSSQLVHLLNVPQTGFTTGDLMKPLLIILAWTIVLTIVSVVLCQRRLKDE